MGKSSLYSVLTQVLSYGVSSDEPLVCCHECECIWAGNSKCFICDKIGEVLAVPKHLGQMTIISHGMLSDELVVVSSDLADFLKQERSRLSRRSSGMESVT